MPHAKRKANPSTARREQYLEKLLSESIQPHNQAPVRRFVTAKQAEGVKLATSINYTIGLLRLQDHMGSVPLLSANPDQLTDFLASQAKRKSAYTLWGYAATLRLFFKWHNPDKLDPAIPRSLRRRMPRRQEQKPVSEEEFRKLLKAASESHDARNRLKVQAFLWVLWDSGFRIGEICSLRVESVEFDGADGARLQLPSDTDGLKTGPRRVYVVECVGALRAWLTVHPHGANPEAALFCSDRGSGLTPYWSQNWNQVLKRLCKAAGTRHMYPHLFRHTRATRAAQAGWNDAKMRPYFGWSVTSDMPSVLAPRIPMAPGANGQLQRPCASIPMSATPRARISSPTGGRKGSTMGMRPRLRPISSP